MPVFLRKRLLCSKHSFSVTLLRVTTFVSFHHTRDTGRASVSLLLLSSTYLFISVLIIGQFSQSN